MSGYEVWTEQLRTAAGGWRDQQEALRDARTSVVSVEGTTGSVGPVVSATLDAVLDTWVEELRRLSTAAESYADELEAAATTYDATDEAARQRLESLLPWDARGSAPR